MDSVKFLAFLMTKGEIYELNSNPICYSSYS